MSPVSHQVWKLLRRWHMLSLWTGVLRHAYTHDAVVQSATNAEQPWIKTQLCRTREVVIKHLISVPVTRILERWACGGVLCIAIEWFSETPLPRSDFRRDIILVKWMECWFYIESTYATWRDRLNSLCSSDRSRQSYNETRAFWLTSHL